jgi:putative ABC transport system substrate-binding protein
MTVLAGAAAYPLAAGAQQKGMPVIGYLAFGSPDLAPTPGVFLQGLSETGYAEGQNVAIEYRWAGGRYDRLPALAADLVGRKVDVIFAAGDAATVAARDATSTIPIRVHERRPGRARAGRRSRPAGGNLTGVSLLTLELMAKRLELLSELEAARVKGVELLILKGQHRKRDRRRFRLPRPTTSPRAPRQPRPVFQHPACAARGAGGAACRSSDISVG